MEETLEIESNFGVAQDLFWFMTLNGTGGGGFFVFLLSDKKTQKTLFSVQKSIENVLFII